jgi:hypothetical protein
MDQSFSFVFSTSEGIRAIPLAGFVHHQSSSRSCSWFVEVNCDDRRRMRKGCRQPEVRSYHRETDDDEEED